MHKRSKRLRIGLILLALSLLSTTYAANITLNKGNKVNFSQGVLQISACSQWVSFALHTEVFNGDVYVSGIDIKGLDAVHCRNALFVVQLYNGASQLDLFQGAFSNANNVTIGIGNAKTQMDTTYLVDENRLNIGYSNDYESLLYDSKTGTYNVSWSYPLALARNVTNITVQTTGTRN